MHIWCWLVIFCIWHLYLSSIPALFCVLLRLKSISGMWKISCRGLSIYTNNFYFHCHSKISFIPTEARTHVPTPRKLMYTGESGPPKKVTWGNKVGLFGRQNPFLRLIYLKTSNLFIRLKLPTTLQHCLHLISTLCLSG